MYNVNDINWIHEEDTIDTDKPIRVNRPMYNLHAVIKLRDDFIVYAYTRVQHDTGAYYGEINICPAHEISINDRKYTLVCDRVFVPYWFKIDCDIKDFNSRRFTEEIQKNFIFDISLSGNTKLIKLYEQDLRAPKSVMYYFDDSYSLCYYINTYDYIPKAWEFIRVNKGNTGIFIQMNEKRKGEIQPNEICNACILDKNMRNVYNDLNHCRCE